VRVVADTNTVVSALLWRGSPYRLFQAVNDDRISLYTSRVLLDEFEDVLSRRKFVKAIRTANETLASLIQHYQELAHLVRPRPLTARVSRDRDDDHVIACALAAKASLIVSGDGDLRDLGTYKGIRILNAADALRLIAQ
jgi:putative PIN family toxin of toxin-antitoxin system